MTLEEFEAKPLSWRLRAPSYWMSGSGEGHEGENNLPFKAADAIDEHEKTIQSLKSQRDTLRKALEEEIVGAWRAGLGAGVGSLSIVGGRPGRTIDDDAAEKYAAYRLAALTQGETK